MYKSDIRAKKGKYVEAISLLKESLEIGKTLNKIDLLVKIYERLSNLYEKQNNYKESLAYFKLFKTEFDKLAGEKSSNKVMELEFEHQKAKELKEKEIQLEKEKSQNNLFILISISFALLVLILVFIILYRQRASQVLENKNTEIEKQKAQLELKTEELNKKNLELNEVNQTKDKFFSILAHDLKNPFAVLINYTSMLKDEYHILSDEDKIDMISKTNSVSNNSFQLLENLLTWARTQTGSITINNTIVDLKSTVLEVITLFNDIANHKKIELNISLEDNLAIVSDEDMLRTIFRNLISNAIKFSFSNSKIDIVLKKEGNTIVFKVKDYGTGMCEETKNGLFRIDVSVSKQGTNREKGTGLGLIMTNEFIQKINGRILVESELNNGSTFSVVLPKNN